MVGRMALVQSIKRLVDNEPVTSDVGPESENHLSWTGGKTTVGRRSANSDSERFWPPTSVGGRLMKNCGSILAD